MNTRQIANIFILIIVLAPLTIYAQKSIRNQQIVVDSLNNRVKQLTEANQRLIDNKKMVADFYQQLFGDKDAEAIDKYIGETYIQHNPILPDGRDTLKKTIKLWFKGVAKEKINIQHLSADGDLVYIHTKSKFGNKTMSVIDIFRIENGKIVEHWDIIQEVPEKSANPHPMF